MVSLNTDRFGRIIDYLRISITDRCNLRCIYCMPDTGIELFPHSEILSYEEIIRLAKIFASIGIKKIRLTGGEPLIRRNLTHLIENISGIDGIEDVSLTTNGILLHSMLVDLKKAGLKRINISLDTLVPDKFLFITKTDGLHQVLKAIDSCMAADMNPVKINMVVIKGLNDDEILNFALLAQNNPLHIRYIEHMPWGRRNLWDENKVLHTGDIKQKLESRFGPLSASDNTMKGPAKYFRLNGFKGMIGFIDPVSSHFCSLCNRIRLTSDGKLRLCLFSEEEIDLKHCLRNDAAPEEKIRKLILSAISSKPENKEAAGYAKNRDREMSQIGG
jgi:cyclic pyranopterin phosphate synthase